MQEEKTTLLNSSAFQMIEQIGDDWNDYFKLSAENIKIQIAELENWHKFHSNQN